MREKMLAIADRLDKRAEAIFNNLYRGYWREQELTRDKGEHFKKPFPKSQMAGALVILAEEIRETLSTVTYHKYDGSGDLFTIAEFIEHAGDLFIDSDGMGYYAKEKRTPGDGMQMHESDRDARPSRISGGDVSEDFTHVVWYNK